jgi:ABC-type multidrug transport system fused ATPase/permease subunit
MWLYQPIRDIAEKYTLIQKAMASSERIVELLSVADDVPDPAQPVALATPIQGALALDDVSFAYVKDAPPALEHVTLDVKPGETLAIVGATGAGKSTIANLVARFWDPITGAVRLDGVDVKKLAKRELRRHVALVLQDVFLFAGTIEENIALMPSPLAPADRARVEAAARAVAAHEIIERLGGYGAVVEERGATLSHGERQLISFARALAQNPSVLVLDEATASLDPETEARLQAGVKALTKGRTAIVIAHRLATVREANRIAVLHKGKLRELGSHDELVKQDGLYARLVELQMGAPAAAAT